MQIHSLTARTIAGILPLALVLVASQGKPVVARETVRLDSGWRFHPGDVADGQSQEVDIASWSTVDLPHDWSIGSETDFEASTAGGGGFFLTGIGCYRHEFDTPASWRGKRVVIEFDGVYGVTQVWLNGELLGEHLYGYTPFRFDLSTHLREDGPNVLAVRVDNSAQPNTRWYSGSGIYRHVRLVVTDRLRVADDSVCISTSSASEDSATLSAKLGIRNDTSETQEVAWSVKVVAADGELAAEARGTTTVAAGAVETVKEIIALERPSLWCPESPSLYSAVVSVSRGGKEVDSVMVPFGVRTVEVSVDKGLLLNGRAVILCGGNVHHDNGVLGAAAYDRAEERRVELVKAAGFNAIRTSHNPPSAAFLDACDRLGMLVLDEAFDGWAAKKTPFDYGVFFHKHWREDLSAMLLRDRNHPSVIMWSIGNEMYERGNEKGLEITKLMVKHVKEIDTSRPVSAGVCGLWGEGDWPKLDPLFAELDVAGYNYELKRYAEDHKRVPDRIMMSTESYPKEAFEMWDATVSAPYVLGDFVWTAMDYLGEAAIGRVFGPDEQVKPHWEGNHFPWHGAACGDIDLIGNRRPLSHYRNIVWDRGEKLYAAVRVPPPAGGDWQLSKWAHPPLRATWDWPEHVGEQVTVEVYSRYPEVRLYLNDKLVDESRTDRNSHFRCEFQLDYAPGVLKVVGVSDGKEQEVFTLRTPGEPSRLRLTPDRTRIAPDGQDLSFVAVEVTDADGQVCTHSAADAQFSLSGPGLIAGVGNADVSSRAAYGKNPQQVFEGCALVVVKASQAGAIELTATSPGLEAAETVIIATESASQP